MNFSTFYTYVLIILSLYIYFFHPHTLGTLGAIAGKASMGLVNLDHPEKLLCKIKRNCKEDVRELQFSLGTETLFAVAAGTKVSYVSNFI